MASTVGERFDSGTIVATGANIDIRSMGFKPRKVRLHNSDTVAVVDWNEGLADAYGIKCTAAGTRSLETTLGITPLDPDSAGNPGFRIGAMVDVNDTTTETILWEAWG